MAAKKLPTAKERNENQHARTRRDHAFETAEDYVEAIQRISEENGQCRQTDLSKHFAVSHVTASKILSRLCREGFVETIPYGPVTLTADGVSLAKKSQKRHAIVLEFLKALGVKDATAEIDTEGIEHHVSDETLKCMQKFVKDRRSAT